MGECHGRVGRLSLSESHDHLFSCISCYYSSSGKGGSRPPPLHCYNWGDSACDNRISCSMASFCFSQASTKSLPDNSESPPSTCEEFKGQLDEQQKRIDALEAAVAHLAKKGRNYGETDVSGNEKLISYEEVPSSVLIDLTSDGIHKELGLPGSSGPPVTLGREGVDHHPSIEYKM
ncbi:hypothetical protein EB796_015527 [Bugula neritina]|uniref:Uncharacterized protein n=1 Tax=Bugula neritina TaxID=10212 RepID=A0A7J7JIS5_BUGNE|nr:hypothetical protein EB796_015527 [Bugula neritina]